MKPTSLVLFSISRRTMTRSSTVIAALACSMLSPAPGAQSNMQMSAAEAQVAPAMIDTSPMVRELAPTAQPDLLPSPRDTPLAKAAHILRRISFGPTPTELSALRRYSQQELDKYIEYQLSPVWIRETHPDLASLLGLLNLPIDQQGGPWNIADVERHQLIRATFSRRQLQEVMTNFWERHFNTYYPTVRNWFPQDGASLAAYFEHRENMMLRERAVGNFYELLVTSATSPTMLIYLDSVSNIASAPNENFPRELFELHVFGTDPETGAPNVYTEQDIEEAARAFTGWTVCQMAEVDNPYSPCGSGEHWGFHFDAANHDYGEKVFFAGTAYELVIPARAPGSRQGLKDGFELLQHVANLEPTATFITRKLLAQFIGVENVSDRLREQTLKAWRQSQGGDLRSALRTILRSKEFQGTRRRWNRLETPFESLVSTVRALDGRASSIAQLDTMRNAMNALGQRQFYHPSPDGYAIESIEQLGTAKYLERVKFSNRILDGSGFSYDIVSLLRKLEVDAGNPVAVVRALRMLLFQLQFSRIDHVLAIDFLNTDLEGEAVPLDPSAADFAARIHHFAVYLSSIPQAFEK